MEITIKWNLDSKSDEEFKKKVMELLKKTQGTLLPPLPDWDPEELRNEIQDLKLENDRLKQQNNIMFDFICSISCSRKQCKNCKLNRPEMFEKLGERCAYLQGQEGLNYIRGEAIRLLEKMEDL